MPGTFLQVAAQVYAPGQYNLLRTIAPGTVVNGITLTFTRDLTWLDGPAGAVALFMPNGRIWCMSFDGGTLLDRLGNPLSQTSATFVPPAYNDAAGNPLPVEPFPVGVYRFVMVTQQAISTAITGTWF